MMIHRTSLSLFVILCDIFYLIFHHLILPSTLPFVRLLNGPCCLLLGCRVSSRANDTMKQKGRKEKGNGFIPSDIQTVFLCLSTVSVPLIAP